MERLTKKVKRTYLRYLAVPEAMMGRWSEAGVDSDCSGLPINQDYRQPSGVNCVTRPMKPLKKDSALESWQKKKKRSMKEGVWGDRGSYKGRTRSRSLRSCLLVKYAT